MAKLPDLPRSPERRGRNRKATEAALLAAATTVFAERGFETATTKAIAERAGYSEALIQNYFKGKEGLLLAVMQGERGGTRQIEDFYERPLCSNMTAEVLETIEFFDKVVRRRSPALRIILSRVLVDSKFKDHFSKSTIRRLTKRLLETRYQRYQAAGLMERSLDAATAAEMLITLGFALNFVYPEILRESRANRKRAVSGMMSLFVRALAPQR